MNENIDVLAQNQIISELNDKYIIFRLGSNKNLFPIKNIKEIIKRPQIIAAPNLPEYYLGYFKLRDDIIPIVSLRKRLGLSSLEQENQNFIEMLKQREQDHINWLNELKISVKEDKEFKLQRDPHKCAFGMWKDNFKTNSLIFSSQLRKFDEPHAVIHNLADIVTEQAKHNKERALNTLEVVGRPVLDSMINLFHDFYKLIEETQKETVIIFFDKDKYFGILVDGVEKIIKLTTDKIDAPPEDQEFNKFLIGFGKSEEQFYLIYDEILLK